MPLDTEVQSRLSLLVGIDKATYNKTQQLLANLFRDRMTISLDDSQVKDIVDKFREATRAGGKDAGDALTARFDESISDMLTNFAAARKNMMDAVAAGSEANFEKYANESSTIEAQIEAEMEAHKKRLEAAKKLKDATSFNVKNAKEYGKEIESGFSDALNKMKAGDVAGLAESLFGSLTKVVKHKSMTAQLGAESAGSEGAAEALSAAAASLGVVAASLAAIGVAVAGIAALFVMVDDAAKELNKTMLEGASIADFQQQSQNSLMVTMESSMEAARAASLDMATQFRGSGEEMAGILQQLNSAGLTYREMAKGATNAAEEQEKYADAIRTTFQWSKALGMSTAEIADTTAEWSTDFGHGLDQISDDFATIGKYAMQGGFNVKRFFTAVSQATSGLAIYNIRMEEAAYLLSKTQKILGGTDASEFIKSLTQGFTDESMTDRLKRIMIAGAGDTQRIFEDSAGRAAKGFVDAFGSTDTKKALEDAFASVNKKFDIGDPVALQKTWGEMDAKSRRLVIAELRKNGDEQAQAAARQLETLGRLTDGAEGGLNAQARGLGALDMQGKLAYKLQTLGDKRLNDMSVQELAAFESYAGISGAQLEQLMRVESQLMADYELAKKNGTTSAKSFNDWVSSNEDAQKQLEDVKDIESSAEYYARKNVENTRSVFAILKNTIATILNDIYDVLSEWFGWSKKMSPADTNHLEDAISQIRLQREEGSQRLSDLDDQLEKVNKTIQTTGEDSDAHRAAVQEKADIEAAQRQTKMSQDYLRAQESSLSLMPTSVVAGAQDSGALIAEAAKQLRLSGKDMEIAKKNLSADELAALQSKVDAVAPVTTTIPAVTGGRMADETGYASREVTDTDATASKQADAFQEALDASYDLDADSAKALLSTDATSADTLALDKKQALLDRKWMKSGFKDKAEEAHLDALKAYEGWKLGTYAGLTGDDLAQGMEEYASGQTAAGTGVLHDALVTKGYDFGTSSTPARPGGSGLSVEELLAGDDNGQNMSSVQGQDFVMRPGQPAQRFNPSDTILGMKAGGPLVSGGGGGGVVNITINGGDQAAVYRTVKDALKNSGLRP